MALVQVILGRTESNLKLNQKHRKELEDFEKDILRKIVGVRRKTPMSILYKIKGQMPIISMGTVDKEPDSSYQELAG